MPDKKPILFSTASYEYLQKAMMASDRFADGLIARGQSKDGPVYEDKPFPDGERYHRIMTEVADHEVILLGGTIDDRETMELLDLGQAVPGHEGLLLGVGALLLLRANLQRCHREELDGEGEASSLESGPALQPQGTSVLLVEVAEVRGDTRRVQVPGGPEITHVKITQDAEK